MINICSLFTCVCMYTIVYKFMHQVQSTNLHTESETREYLRFAGNANLSQQQKKSHSIKCNKPTTEEFMRFQSRVYTVRESRGSVLFS